MIRRIGLLFGLSFAAGFLIAWWGVGALSPLLAAVGAL